MGEKADFYEAVCGKAETLSALGRFDEAVVVCNAAIVLNPEGQEQAYVDRAFAYLKQGLAKEAVSDYAKVEAMQKQTPQVRQLHAAALSMLGNTCDAAGEAEAALEHFDKSVRLKDDDLRVLFNRALALSKVDRRGEAKTDLQSILAKEPDNGNAHAALGSMLAADGNFAEALEHMLEARDQPGGTVDVIPPADLLHDLAFCFLKVPVWGACLVWLLGVPVARTAAVAADSNRS